MPKSQDRPPEPRVAIFSPRAFEDHVSRSHGYEFEDVIVSSLDSVDLFAPRPGRFWPYLSKVRNRLSYRTAVATSVPADLEPLALERDYDLFFFTIAQLRDLNQLGALRGWRQRSRAAICWIQELWVHDFDHLGPLLDRLNDFDAVICSFTGTADALRTRLKTPVHYIPWGLDAVHFCPYPDPPRRAIDFLSIGVRHEATHAALVDYADRTGRFYSYETISGRAGMSDYRAHRHNYVGLIQRSRYFFSYLAKIERSVERGDQVEFGLRYLEGMAGGAVILGTRIDSEAFRSHLDWEDSVIDIPYDYPDIGTLIDRLEAEPDRLAAISRRNITECLARHDHLYRWQAVLDLAGLPATPAMARRKARLDDLISAASAREIPELIGS